MIDDWRAKWFEGTNKATNEMFPFGFVQVSQRVQCQYTLNWHTAR